MAFLIMARLMAFLTMARLMAFLTMARLMAFFATAFATAFFTMAFFAAFLIAKVVPLVVDFFVLFAWAVFLGATFPPRRATDFFAADFDIVFAAFFATAFFAAGFGVAARTGGTDSCVAGV